MPTSTPSSIPNERRQTCQAGLLDSCIQKACQLASSHDPAIKALGSQLLDELTPLRREVPMRRKHDIEKRK